MKALLLYTISKTIRGYFMSRPIVPIELPQARPCNKKNKKELLLKVRIGKLELNFFQALNQEMIENLLDKMLLYDDSSILSSKRGDSRKQRDFRGLFICHGLRPCRKIVDRKKFQSHSKFWNFFNILCYWILTAYLRCRPCPS